MGSYVDQLQPIAVTFSVPQADFQRLVGLGHFERPLTTQAYSQDTGAPLGRGELRIADNHVDANTGTVQLKARFANSDGKLWPGQFVNVRLKLSVLHDALTIPNSAVNHGPEYTYVYLVRADKHVALRESGRDGPGCPGSHCLGPSSGREVVTDGQMSLKPGSLVSVRGVVSGAATVPLAQRPLQGTPAHGSEAVPHHAATVARPAPETPTLRAR